MHCHSASKFNSKETPACLRFAAAELSTSDGGLCCLGAMSCAQLTLAEAEAHLFQLLCPGADLAADGSDVVLEWVVPENCAVRTLLRMRDVCVCERQCVQIGWLALELALELREALGCLGLNVVLSMGTTR